MPIPQAQLTTWSHQGAVATSSNAYNGIRNALLVANSPLNGRGVDIYLQGSYANTTNIYGDSDVDVVVFYENTFFKDLSKLTYQEQAAHEAAYGPASYHWTNLRDDTLAALRNYFGTNAAWLGKKSIKVKTGYGTKESDVVPAVEFRNYTKFVNRNDMLAHWGIQFFDSANNSIVNYPKYHIKRGEDKNSANRTNGQYKPTVRLFKNMRNYAIDNGLLGDKIAPSYFVECALHNVPDNLFTGQFATTVPSIISYLLNTPYAPFMCQNGVTALIGTGSTQWSENDFAAFVGAIQSVWENW